MKRTIKLGLAAGVIGAVVNICVSTAFGVCGPFVALLAGAVAGFFAARVPELASKGMAAREGAVGGGIAGALVFFGQLVGGLGALALVRVSGAPPIFGTIPTGDSPAGQQIAYWVSGLGVGACFGVIGLALAALAGAGAAYLAYPSRNPQVTPSQPSA